MDDSVKKLLLFAPKAVLLSFLIAISFTTARPQVKFAGPVKIGEKVPDIILKKIVNYNVPEGRLSDIGKGKLVILDFWSTWCTVCIEQFPKLHDLQQQFGDKLLILPVGIDTYNEGSIEAFIKKRRGTPRELLLPSAILEPGDTSLLGLFPYTGLPAEVWIDADGIFRAMTDHRSLTESNIERMLTRPSVQLPLKKVATTIKQSDAFIIRGRPANSGTTFGSVITGYQDSVSSNIVFGRQFDSSYIRLIAINQNLFQLYFKTAYKDSVGGDYKRIVFNVKDRPSFILPEKSKALAGWEYEQYKLNNLFCYESILPPAYTVAQARQFMIADLDKYFKLSSRIEKRNVKCLVLKRDSSGDKLQSAPAIGSEISEDQLDEKLRGIFIGTVLMNQLSFLLPGHIIMNETGYTGKIDIDIHLGKGYGLADVRAALRKHGLHLVETKRKINMLVLE